MDFTTNYCGPYWSDGKFQSSVASGREPVSELDAACMRHDRAYALAKTQHDLIVADNKFYNETKKLGIRGPIYGGLVKYGNSIARDSMAFVLPFFSLLGASAVSTAVLSSQLPKSGLRGTRTAPAPAIAEDQQVCYDPVILPDTQAPKINQVLPSENTSPITKFGLYKPLGRRRLRQQLKNKNKIIPQVKPQKIEKSKQSNSPDNKNNKKTLKTKNDQKAKQTKHVDQENCQHPEIRTCYNYKYCTRCDREFHPR